MIDDMEFNRFDKFVEYEDAIYGIDPFEECYLIACHEETEDYWIAYPNPIQQEEIGGICAGANGTTISKEKVRTILSGPNVEWDEE